MQESNQLVYRKLTLKSELKPFVKYAWSMKSTGVQAERDLLIPDGYPELIFIKKGAYRKAFIPPNSTPVIIQDSCLIGIQTQTVLANPIGDCHFIGFKLNPIGAYELFSDELKKALDTNVSLVNLEIDWLNELDRQLQNALKDSAIVDIIEIALTQQIDHLPPNATPIFAAAALNSILEAKGKISVQALAAKHHLSIRQFQRKFKNCFGISPKKFLNLIRFKHLYKSSILQQKLPKDFLNYGYYDQMHFIKDFKKHLGVNPSQSDQPEFLLKNEMAKRNV